MQYYNPMINYQQRLQQMEQTGVVGRVVTVLKINLFLKRIKKTVDSLNTVCYIDGVQIRHNSLSATAKEVYVQRIKKCFEAL